ncbi:MAG TPA: hypothetical protein VN788_10775 [Verrucomicrobiae bacterium]|nr:hypothetical protein [Verrucomicrobiae bacterium]
MISEKELVELHPLCDGDLARECPEFDHTYILLPKMGLPAGCRPVRVDALLCLTGRDGYPTRLYFAERVACKAQLNWNAQDVRILERTWFAYSWTGVARGRPIEVLAQHLKALK